MASPYGHSVRETEPETARVDPIWSALRREADALARREPALASVAHQAVLAHDRYEDALAARLARKLMSDELPGLALRDLIAEAFEADPDIGAAARADMVATLERDAACTEHLQPLLYYKGHLALQAHRVAHWYWRAARADIAYMLQMRISETFAADIHPGARLGRGIMIDHATGVVIGETAVVGDDVSMLHGVTLGGNGKESGDRHPKIGRSVLLGAGASVLGNIHLGDGCRVGAGSVVLESAPACKTLAGVPARIVGDAGCTHPSRTMDHHLR